MTDNLDFDKFLIADATATFDRIGINGEKFSSEIIHQTTLVNLNDEFANVISTEKLLEIV